MVGRSVLEQIPLVIRTLVGVCALVFMARVLGGLCTRFRVPDVVGMILSGVIFGPYALGGIIHVLGNPLVELNETFLAFAQFGGLIFLFAAGLHFTFADFRAAGFPSFIVAMAGVAASFLLGYGACTLLGYGWESSALVGAALTSTSIAVTTSTLRDLKQLRSKEGKIVVNAAVIDSVAALSVLAAATSIIYVGSTPNPIDLMLNLAKSTVLWLILLVAVTHILPRLINLTMLGRARGTVEAAAIASCFGCAFLAAAMNLSPLVGAFAAGMAVAGSKAIRRVEEFSDKLELVFAPVFFASMGAYLSPGAAMGVNPLVFIVIFAVAVAGKVFGCGLPAMGFLRNSYKGLRVGIAMIPGAEVGLIIAGLALASGAMEEGLYATFLVVTVATAVMAPVLLGRFFQATR